MLTRKVSWYECGKCTSRWRERYPVAPPRVRCPGPNCQGWGYYVTEYVETYDPAADVQATLEV